MNTMMNETKGNYYTGSTGRHAPNLDKLDFPTTRKQHDVALSGIQYPGAHDVLSGRGGHATTHPGNIKFRTLIDSFKKHYIQCSKYGKTQVANHILTIWRGQTPPGRFLIKVDSLKEDSLWEDIGDKAAVKKIAQALRERRSYPMVPTNATAPFLPTDLYHASLRGTEQAVFPSMAPHEQEEKIRAIEQEISQLKQRNRMQQELENHMRQCQQQQLHILPAVSEEEQDAEPMDASRTTPDGDTTNEPSSSMPSGKPPLPPLKAFPDREESNHFSQIFDSVMSASGGDSTRSLGKCSSEGSHERRQMMRDSIGSFSDHSSGIDVQELLPMRN